MRIVAAIDSFKGSMTSVQAGAAVAAAALRLDPQITVDVCPLADGGEGTVDAFCESRGGESVAVSVQGPLSEKTLAKYCILKDRGTAVMEMAAASGITLLPRERLDPLRTTTCGVGEMIMDALKRGCRRFIIGIGGSATNDGGAGMLSALGYRFLDKNGAEIPRGAGGLALLDRIDASRAEPMLHECVFQIACDVKNPLCGDNGCTAVFGPQKGVSPDMIPQIDGWMRHYAEKARELIPDADENYPGAGAAGGLGFAFMTFLRGRLKPGIEIVLEETGLAERIKNADLVVTGEGRIDAQTAMGKAPAGVAAAAKKYGKPVIAFAGCLGNGAEKCNDCGIDALFPILRSVTTLDEAMRPENAVKNLTETAYQVLRLIRRKI